MVGESMSSRGLHELYPDQNDIDEYYATKANFSGERQLTPAGLHQDPRRYDPKAFN